MLEYRELKIGLGDHTQVTGACQGDDNNMTGNLPEENEIDRGMTCHVSKKRVILASHVGLLNGMLNASNHHVTNYKNSDSMSETNTAPTTGV